MVGCTCSHCLIILGFFRCDSLIIPQLGDISNLWERGFFGINEVEDGGWDWGDGFLGEGEKEEKEGKGGVLEMGKMCVEGDGD